MIKYILLLLMITNVYAEPINKYECTLNSQLNDCLTPQQLKVLQKAYDHQQLLSTVENEEYIEQPYKHEKNILHSTNNRCTMIQNLLQQCPTANQIKFMKLMNDNKNRRIHNVSTIKTKSKSHNL
jgi:hypothetical protein